MSMLRLVKADPDMYADNESIAEAPKTTLPPMLAPLKSQPCTLPFRPALKEQLGPDNHEERAPRVSLESDSAIAPEAHIWRDPEIMILRDNAAELERKVERDARSSIGSQH